MIEHKAAESYKDVGNFYDEKYKIHGYETFKNTDRRKYIDLLEGFGGTFSAGNSILDAGCGHGEFLAALPVGLKKFGIDASLHAVELARKRPENEGAVIVQGDLESVDEVFGAKPIFDFIASLGVLEHTMNPKRAFNNLKYLLLTSGIMLILVPLEFDDCLYQLRQESNQKTNERFASVSEWIDFFETTPVHYEILGNGNSRDVALIYRKGIQ